MPVLKDFRTTKKVSLPSYPESEIEFYDSILVGETAQLKMEDNKNIDTMLEFLLKIVKSWNFTNEAGDALPITIENFKILKVNDLTYLFEQITEFANDEKKD